MTKAPRSLAVFALVAMLLLAPATVMAQDAKQGPIGRVTLGGGGISFEPLMTADGWVVTVSGPDDFTMRQEYATGAAVVMYLDTVGGLKDGGYTYEIRPVFRMNPAVAARLQEARDAGDKGQVASLRNSFGAPEDSRTLSGDFRVQGGAILRDDLEEAPIGASLDAIDDSDDGTKDQVINDDLIVTFSACIGNDCVNGESFGFDTLRLKENNLRIDFLDTSNSASFPPNDWEITINDSSNGGASYFAVTDSSAGRQLFRVSAGAPSNSLFVDSQGDVGLGTSTPAVELVIKDGDTPTMRLEQDGTSGFTPQTWDLAGNETNFFVRDVTNGSKLSFRLTPNAPQNSIFVASSGNVGFGTQSPDGLVHVEKSGSNANMVAERTGTGASRVLFSASNNLAIFGTTNDVALRLIQNNVQRMRFHTNGNLGIGDVVPAAGNAIEHENGAFLTTAGVWTDASSRAFKADIQPLNAEEAMAALAELEPVTYLVKKAPEEGRYAGFIAEDVPELVASANRKGMSPMDVVATLTKVVQEQQAQIAELSGRLEGADAERTELLESIDALQAMVRQLLTETAEEAPQR